MLYNGFIMTTRELLQRCIDRDHAAWDDFVRRYTGLVTKSVRHKLKKFALSIEAGEFSDIIQEVFLHIWEKNKLEKVANADSLEGWLAIVSLNITGLYCRRKIFKHNRLVSLDDDISKDTEGLKLDAIVHAGPINLEKALESHEMANIVRSEIDKLGYKQQLALKLNVYDGKKHREISKIMNIPAGTVGYLIKDAKGIIRGRIKKIVESDEKEDK